MIASFAQHTSRDNDPQLHVHNAILNRVLREDPLASRPGDRRAWRTLDGAALYAAKPAAGAIAERTLAEYLSDRLGVQTVARPDGNGWEIAGVSEEVRDQFSSRRRAIGPRVQQLIERIRAQARQGAERARGLVDGAIRDARFAPRQGAFGAVPGSAAGAMGGAIAPRRDRGAQRHPRCRARPARAAGAEARPAVGRRRGPDPGRRGGGRAAVQGDVLPVRADPDDQPVPAGLPRRPVRASRSRSLLEELTSEALRPGGPAGTVLLTAPEMVPVPEAYRRADGLSLWRRHGAEIYTTRAMLDTEARLLRAAAQTGAPKIAPERAAAALGADRARVEARLWREHGHPGAAGAPGSAGDAPDGAEPPLSSAGLADDQAQAAYGVLTSGRAIDILVGAAGTGKTRTVARLAAGVAGGRRRPGDRADHVHERGAHPGRRRAHRQPQLRAVPGPDPKAATRPAGTCRCGPVTCWWSTRPRWCPPSDLAAVEDIATRCGAKILLTGDTEQLSAPEAGGAMRLLADEHGYYQLCTVQRFEQEWERAGVAAAARR